MANNRMYLVHRSAGIGVFLGKRMTDGYYNVPEDIAQRLQELYNNIEKMWIESHGDFSLDDFCVALESGEHQPHAIDTWTMTKDGRIPEFSFPDKVPRGIPEEF